MNSLWEGKVASRALRCPDLAGVGKVRSNKRNIKEPPSKNIRHLGTVPTKESQHAVGLRCTVGNMDGPLKVVTNDHAQIFMRVSDTNRSIRDAIGIFRRLALT